MFVIPCHRHIRVAVGLAELFLQHGTLEGSSPRWTPACRQRRCASLCQSASFGFGVRKKVNRNAGSGLEMTAEKLEKAGSVAAEAATHRDSRQLQLGLVPCVAVGLPVDSVEAIVMGNFDCWIDGFNYDTCCDPKFGPSGNSQCWDGVFNYDRCCFPKDIKRPDAGCCKAKERHLPGGIVD
eukprot:symbB.v1.2.025987.t1/scaffold2555.1/size76423/8